MTGYTPSITALLLAACPGPTVLMMACSAPTRGNDTLFRTGRLFFWAYFCETARLLRRKPPSGKSTIQFRCRGIYDSNMCVTNSWIDCSLLLLPFKHNRNRFNKSKWINIKPFTDFIKKSWCSTLTIPKFVYLKRLSIIHIRFEVTPFLGLKQAISRGTSAVLWWLAITSVRSSKQSCISSPISTTKNTRKHKYPLPTTEFTQIYHRIQRSNSTSTPSPTTNERNSPQYAKTYPDWFSSAARAESSRQHRWECSRHCSAIWRAVAILLWVQCTNACNN